MNLIEVKEHEEIKEIELFENLDVLDVAFGEGDFSFLGLHREFNNGKLGLYAYYILGLRKIGNNLIFITPKEYKNRQIDYIKLFNECLKDNVVSKRLDTTFKIFFEDEWIEIENKYDLIIPFIIYQFNEIVNQIVKKGLKKNYVKKKLNLNSKIKGKILIAKNIKHNLSKNRLYMNYCNYEEYSVDCLENQILKTALILCKKYSPNSLKLKNNLLAFNEVSIRNITFNDFKKLKHSIFFSEYTKALELAKLILKRFGYSPNINMEKIKRKIPQYYINMPELFERWVEIKLRNKYKENLIAGYGLGNGFKTEIGELRPDFIVKNNKKIIDAKYKYWYDNKFDKDDLMQLSLYSRVKKIRKIIGCNENEEAELIFIYPSFEEKEEIKSEDFYKIKKISYKVPIK